MPSVAATMNSIRESTSIPCLVSDDGITATEAQEIAEKRVLSPSQSFDDTKERSLQHSRVEIVRLAMFRKVCKPLSNNQLLSIFLYCTTHFANFKGILGFSVPSII